jgi:4-alpha-glucanotransferase
LWFEKDAQGHPLPAQSYRDLALATVTTHDLPPTAGYLAGEHVELRDALGLLTRPVEQERAADEAARAEVVEMLVGHGLLDPGAESPGSTESADSRAEVVEALHRFLAQTPAKLLGVAVADLSGDHRAINQPGTQDEYPNWRLPMAGPDGKPMLLEELMTSPWAHRLARSLALPARPAVPG